MKKLIRSSYDFTADQVVSIYKLRAAGLKNNEIARKMNATIGATSNVVTRNARPDVPVPDVLREAAEANVHRRINRTKTCVKETPAPEKEEQTHLVLDQPQPGSVVIVLAEYAEAYGRCLRRKATALNAGVSVEMLDMMEIAAEAQTA